MALDATAVVAGDLRAIGAFALVNAAGPWQGSDLRLPRAAIAARMHYIDLADARGYVADFSTLDAEARAAGVIALTGASSTPALSNAVLDVLVHGWRQVDSVEIAISPGNHAPRGKSLVRAILSYAGGPVRLLEEGVWRFHSGWGMTARC
jgi:saccharopine dehydrogenase-like NADP-dependent oxidoreductase